MAINEYPHRDNEAPDARRGAVQQTNRGGTLREAECDNRVLCVTANGTSRRPRKAAVSTSETNSRDGTFRAVEKNARNACERAPRQRNARQCVRVRTGDSTRRGGRCRDIAVCSPSKRRGSNVVMFVNEACEI